MDNKILKLADTEEPYSFYFGVEGLDSRHRVIAFQAEAKSVWMAFIIQLRERAQKVFAFVNGIVGRFQTAKPGWTCESISALELLITTPDGSSQRVNLSNLFARCENVPEDQERIIGEFVTAIIAIAPGRSINPARILPVIQHASIRQVNDVSESLNEELSVQYAEDREDTMSFIRWSDLTRLGIPPEEIKAEALANLERSYPEILFHRVDKRVTKCILDGNYDASLVLMPDVWGKAAHQIKGEFIFGIPSRDSLYFCDSIDDKAIRKLKELVTATFRNAAYPISDKLFVWREGKLEIFKR